MVSINGIEIKQKKFIFDGCHKVYLVDDDDLKDCEARGYNLEKDVFPIEQIDEVFWNTCSLRFIEVWKDFRRIVSQCEPVVVFEINGKTITEDFYNDKVEVK